MAKFLRGGEFVRIEGRIPGEGRGIVGRVLPDSPAFGPDDVVSIMTHGGIATALLSEIAIVRNPPEDFVPMRRRLPYGRWSTAEGGDILFDRDYRPIFARSPDGAVRACAPDEEIERLSPPAEMFYDGSNAPWRCGESATRCEAALAAWGVQSLEVIQ